MELLCPNCQQRVTVPDQYAGQVMKCPLCGNTFTTPSLAPAGSPAFVPPLSAPPPTGPSDFGTPSDAEPFASLSPTPARMESAAAARTAPEPMPGDYRRRLTLWISPRVLPWIAVFCLVIVLILTFFPWVGYYPGGIAVVTQNAWQTAFGSRWADPDLEKSPSGSSTTGEEIKPRVSGLMIVFLIVFLVALIATCAAALLGILPNLLPSSMEALKTWRWAIVSGIAFLAFLFFVLQLLGGFDLTNQVRDRASMMRSNMAKAPATTPEQKHQVEKAAEIASGMMMVPARYTCTLWCSFWLTLLALVCAVLTFILGRRQRPLPKLEFLW